MLGKYFSLFGKWKHGGAADKVTSESYSCVAVFTFEVGMFSENWCFLDAVRWIHYPESHLLHSEVDSSNIFVHLSITF